MYNVNKLFYWDIGLFVICTVNKVCSRETGLQCKQSFCFRETGLQCKQSFFLEKLVYNVNKVCSIETGLQCKQSLFNRNWFTM